MSDQARRVQAQFGASAAAYVTSAGHAAGDDLEQLAAWGRALGPTRVLDLATGGGHTALAFAAITPRVVAYDVTEPMLRAARGLLREQGHRATTFVAGDVETLPFRDGAFDLVTCRIAAHHFGDVAAAVREVRRVLRPGGSFLLQDILGHDDGEAAAFVTEVERRRDPSHVRAYRAVEWKAFLRAAGLTPIDTAIVAKGRLWEEWTTRTRMSPQARRELDCFVLAAPARCRAAFDFRISDGRIESFSDRMLLVRADRD
jgi:SAM-dependent methyltransferase